ncbi:NLI interacting factor, partial [Terfezia claveryi]
PNPILIILDLNGALLHRSRGSKATQSSKRPHPRPYLTQFLNYLFAHFSVMVWSSALPANVASMVAAAFTPEQRESLVAVWGRDTLGLSKEQMFTKVVVYKRLEKVWESVGLSKGGKCGGVWSQANTVLVDDSAVKASAQPFNLVEISTWEGGQDGAKDRELLEVAGYLEKMRRGGWVDVSAWMRMRPFRKG